MRNKPNNQYDGMEIWKDVADFDGQNIRVTDSRSVADRYYSHFRASYNSLGKPTSVTYYNGTAPHKTLIGCLSDVSGSLNNKYLTIHDNPSNQKYHIWFNVNGAGTDPAPADSLPIEIPLLTNDTSSIVAVAITLVINSLFSRSFTAQRQVDGVDIASVKYGFVDDSIDFNTGFTIANTRGSQEVTNQIDITYDGSDPIFEGQLLKGYSYDIYSGKFLKDDAPKEESLLVDEASATVLYVGVATLGTSTSDELWKIFKVETTGSVTSILYANASLEYNSAWDDRASLSYS